MTKISAFIITHNNENTLESCLKSLNFVSEIIVVDDFSSDKTIDICRKYQAKIFSRKFDDYSSQKKFALEKTQNLWVFSIDSDEIVTKELSNEISKLDFQVDAYQIPRQTYFLGKPLLHGGKHLNPGYVLRLFNKEKCHFTDLKVHEKVVTQGKIQNLQSPMMHYSYRNLHHYFEKMNLMTDYQADPSITPWKSNNYFLMFLKACYRFFQTYIFHQGFLDGFRGFMVSLSSVFYVFMVYFKAWEKKLNGHKE